MKSCLYEGQVRHRRREPVEHGFAYRLFMVYVDLSELDDVFRGRLLWSARRPAIAWLRRADHLGDPAVPLDEAVRDLVAAHAGARPRGPIRLLTHLRYFGCGMNPVSFYYVFDEHDREVETIVAEVHNTPWGERHCYVLDPRARDDRGPALSYRFEKDFHVSPFFEMDLEYRWRFEEPDDALVVSMENRRDGTRVFEAQMQLARRPITGWSLARALARYPVMTGTVLAAIYWQALRLWLKGCPFHSHPRHAAPEATPR